MMFDDRGSTYIGNLGPVPLFVHPSALLMLVTTFMWYNNAGISIVLLAFMVLVIGILLHELGHGAAARFQGASHLKITLWALGGLCSSNRDPNKHVSEIITLAAGPLVSFILCIIGLLLGNSLLQAKPDLMIQNPNIIVDMQHTFYREQILEVWTNIGFFSHMTILGQFLALMFFMNLWLGIFNCLPIYPLDGGQITYHTLSLILRRREVVHKICMAVSVIFVVFALYWQFSANQGQFTPNTVFTTLFLGFLLYNAYHYLRV